MIRKVDAQREYLEQFGKDLRSAARIEKFLEKHRDELERGGTTLKSLLGGAANLPEEK